MKTPDKIFYSNPGISVIKTSRAYALQYLPVSLFGSTVALSGLSIAFKTCVRLFGLPQIIGDGIGIVAWAVFLLLMMGYAYKIICFPDRVKAELAHPVTANFFGTFFISAVLLSTIAAPHSLPLARITWITGTFGGICFVCLLTARLFKGALNSLDLVPPMLIPGLTILNAVTAHASIDLGWWSSEADRMLFAIGMVYVMVFFVIITYRLVHREPVITFLKPTLLLMSAPFEVGFLSYISTKPQIDEFASVLFYFGLFIFIVLFFIVFAQRLPFMVSWWGACFSMCALTNAALQYARLSHLFFIKGVSVFLLITVTLAILITLTQTIRNLITGRLLVP